MIFPAVTILVATSTGAKQNASSVDNFYLNQVPCKNKKKYDFVKQNRIQNSDINSLSKLITIVIDFVNLIFSVIFKANTTHHLFIDVTFNFKIERFC